MRLSHFNIPILFVLIMLFSCINNHPFLESTNGFPETPVNLSFLNTKYDDYNSDLPPGEGGIYTLAFSSNRNSKGNDFDIILKSLDIYYELEKNTCVFREASGYSSEYLVIDEMQTKFTTERDELGPFIMNLNFHNDPFGEEYLFFYTRDMGGQLDLKFLTYELDSIVGEPGHYGSNRYYSTYGEYEVAAINSEEHSEGYICISENYLFYCSDIAGNFDIYELEIDNTFSIKEFLTQKTTLQHSAKKIVSSTLDDKCPFVIGDYMVFTSNRAGGEGGFDLYYSKKINNEWSEPVNFGSEINSSADDYRPVFINFQKIPNDLMIFSSNREGGLGGFDLYYTGINVTE